LLADALPVPGQKFRVKWEEGVPHIVQGCKVLVCHHGKKRKPKKTSNQVSNVMIKNLKVINFKKTQQHFIVLKLKASNDHTHCHNEKTGSWL